MVGLVDCAIRPLPKPELGCQVMWLPFKHLSRSQHHKVLCVLVYVRASNSDLTSFQAMKNH